MAELLYWFTLDCTNAPNEVAGGCFNHVVSNGKIKVITHTACQFFSDLFYLCVAGSLMSLINQSINN